MTKKIKGSSLVVTLLVLAIILISALSIALVALKERQASIGSTNSNRAYQLADEGIEKVMQIINHGNNNYINKTGGQKLVDDLNIIDAVCSSTTGLINDQGGNYTVELFDRNKTKIKCNDSSRPVLDIAVLKSVGYNKNTSRAISAPISFLESGLIDYWRLNESSGETAYNLAKGGSENIGQLSTNASFKEDHSVPCVSIPDKEYIKVSGLLDTPKSITLSAWVKLSGTGTNGSEVISLGNAVALRINDKSQGQKTVGLFNGSKFTSSNTQLSNNQWYMITYTIDDGKDQKIYINKDNKGNSSYSDSVDYSSAETGENTFLGINGNNDANYNFKGQMREVRVYNRALTAEEITTLYNVSKP